MSISMLHVHVPVTWTEACSMEKGMQHCCKNIDMNTSMDMAMEMGIERHGRTPISEPAWTADNNYQRVLQKS
jgi:hypothetical protein